MMKMSLNLCHRFRRKDSTLFCSWRPLYRKYTIRIRIDYYLSLIKSVSFFEVLLLGRVDEDNGLATFDYITSSSLACGALKSEDNLFGGFGLFVENGFGLTSETSLFHVISSSTYIYSNTLAHWTLFTFLVLGHFVGSMLFTFLAMSLSSFQNANLPFKKIP
jgi:hypothetical protein